MKIFYSPECLGYGNENHPENPARIDNTMEFLKEKIETEELAWEFAEPKICSDDDLLLVHTKEFIEKVRGGKFFDPDTPNYSDIFEIAKIAAGSAISAMNCALNGENAFSLMRPPGHHAGHDFLGGFCYFNNVAVAVAKALKDKKVERVAVLDVDGHFGNGSADIFLNDEFQGNVLYISLHQSPAYPGTGLHSERNCINFPLKPGTNSQTYLEVFDKAISLIKEFNPDLIAVSAGFDTYKKDPLLNLQLDLDTYREIGKKIAQLTNLINSKNSHSEFSYNKKIFVVLEGGYSEELPQCVFEFLRGLEK